MIRIVIDCNAKTETVEPLTLAEEQEVILRSEETKAKEAIVAAKLVSVAAAKQVFAGLDPKTATVEDVVKYLQATTIDLAPKTGVKHG